MGQFLFGTFANRDGSEFQVCIVELAEGAGRGLADFPCHGEDAFNLFVMGMGLVAHQLLKGKAVICHVRVFPVSLQGFVREGLYFR